ncbi:MAG: hypothetical protein A2589_03270 [Candidatus Vogelbacteria bacterium RIFOXYD1_FULL_46_19]|uniref:Uncharacterized protein n=1 Tax=Candidatus Vogelbacteria bacterium RIFOXYD1_FULL_46_19 TaxID=1802439 RepID=A0A1G2QIP1_9BACT|nr:MAG: hypothetical protein A2589_03270 [Candidatus Vogelbacteria bacterium RIFOXYD1_FULL_46_19]
MKNNNDHSLAYILRYFARNLLVVIGLVSVWRGVWYVLDAFDIVALKGNHFLGGLIGIALGLLLLYLPDKDLKEIQKL